MRKGVEVPITPEVLSWAIEESGFEIQDLANKIKVSTNDIDAWLDARSKPSTTVFHRLARALKRPESTFFLPRAPESRERRSSSAIRRAASRQPTPEERVRIREAERLQAGLAWLFEELDGAEPKIPQVDLMAVTPETAATKLRTLLGVPFADQLAWDTPTRAQNAWRSALESFGVFVLLLPMGRNSARGFSIYHRSAPVIAANTHWNYEARIFTLFHELGHLVTRTNSLCEGVGISRKGGDRTERWCEEFAASLLIPTPQATSILDAIKPGRIDDLAIAGRLARKLKVSLRATVIWLIKQQRADESLYVKIRPSADSKTKGGQPPEEPRRRAQARLGEYGRRTVGLFLEAIDRDSVSHHETTSYLGVSDSDIPKLRELVGE